MSEMLQDVTGERRLYIHRDTLGHLACTSEHMAWRVSLLLLDTRLVRQAEHRISQLVDLGVARSEFAEAFIGPLLKARDESFASLATVQYRPKLPYLADGPRPLISADEKLYATCSDGAYYYYFAMSEEAAKRMWLDNLPIRELRENVSKGGVSDLTIVSGDNLIPPDPELDISEHTVPIDLNKARGIEARARSDALKYRIPAHVDWAARQVGGLGLDESDIVTTLVREVFPKELNRPSF